MQRFHPALRPGWQQPGSRRLGLAQSVWPGIPEDGQLFATEHGMDERGARYVVDDPDDFYEIEEGRMVWLARLCLGHSPG